MATNVFLLVEKEYNEAILVEASSVKECVEKYAHYTAVDTKLFKKAILGLTDPNDFIDMYNHFAHREIVVITKLDNEFYGDSSALTYVDGSD